MKKMMGRSKIRLRNAAIPAVSSFALIFGSALLSLAILSFISARVLDGENATTSTNLFPSALLSRPSPAKLQAMELAPGEKQAAVAAQYPNQTMDPVEELRTLQNVPARWNVGGAYLWEAENTEWYYGCSDSSRFFPSGPPPESNGYLYIAASGGLNQQRTGITDAVVVAKLLNATLVVPQLDHKSYWKDNSNFSDIFDVDWFISSVSKDIRVIKDPGLEKSVYTRGVPRKAKPAYYLSKILPILQKRKALRLNRFDYRLSNRLRRDWQKLRCRTNYKALRFTSNIQAMGQTLLDRMRAKSGGRFVALHLRYESDMLAFSGCYYGGGSKEIAELGLLRKRWKTIHHVNFERARRNGKCPLTPKEVGLMLRALGYGKDTYLYVASGEVYNGEDSLAPLKALFPNYFTKETLARKEELEPFTQYSSRMAAVDYIVCSQSDVFVTNNNGNMARILAGERRYHGHKRTIRPNVRKLNLLFSVFQQTPWAEFAAEVQRVQKGFMGDPNEVKIGRGEFHEHPLVCICARPGAPPVAGQVQQALGSTTAAETEQETTETEIDAPGTPDTATEEEEGEEESKEEEEDLPMIIEEEQSGNAELEHEHSDAGGMQVISLDGDDSFDLRNKKA